MFKVSKAICIAHGGDVSEPSGGTNRVIAFATALRDAGFDVHLVVPSPKREFPEDLRDIKIHIVPIKARSIRDQIFRALLVSLKAKKIAKNNNAILQIEHSTLAGFATLVGCSNFVLDMHDLSFISPLWNSPLSKITRRFIYNMEKRAVSKASKIVVVSHPMKEILINEWNVPEKKIEVIPNGYFEEKFKKFNFDIEEVEGMISFLGTLHPKLDLDKIIKLAKSIESSKIYVIGDGSVRNELERKVRENNLENVIITGRLPDREAFSLVAKSQVVIYPLKMSLHTKVLTSVKIFDYAALGKAMVLDDVSGSDIWKEYKEKKAAMFSNPDDPREFVNCVQTLLENESLRKEMGLKAKNIAQKYTWERLGKQLVNLYEKVLK